MSEIEEGEIQNESGADISASFDFIFEDVEVDEQFLRDFEIMNVLKGDFDPIDQYLEEIAYKNLDYKLAQHSKSHKMRKLLKVQ